MQQRLCASHRKHGHHRHTAPAGESVQRGAQLCKDVLRRVVAVTIGGFDQHRIGGRGIVRRVHDRIVRAAQVTREQNTASGDFQQQTGGAENVASGAERGAPAGNGLKGFAPRRCLDQRQAVQGILTGVEGQGGRVFGQTMAVGKRCIFFLDMAAVRQQYFAQRLRSGRRVHVAGESLFKQHREVATVIEVGMG